MCMVLELFYSILSTVNTLYIIIEVLLFVNLVITYTCIICKLRKNRIEPPAANLGTFESYSENYQRNRRPVSDEKSKIENRNGDGKVLDVVCKNDLALHSTTDENGLYIANGILQRREGLQHGRTYGNEVGTYVVAIHNDIPEVHKTVGRFEVRRVLDVQPKDDVRRVVDVQPNDALDGDENTKSNGLKRDTTAINGAAIDEISMKEERQRGGGPKYSLSRRRPTFLRELKSIVISIPFLILITHIPFITIPNLLIAIGYKYGKVQPSFESNSTAVLFNAFGILINACLNLLRKKSIRKRTLQLCFR